MQEDQNIHGRKLRGVGLAVSLHRRHLTYSTPNHAKEEDVARLP